MESKNGKKDKNAYSANNVDDESTNNANMDESQSNQKNADCDTDSDVDSDVDQVDQVDQVDLSHTTHSKTWKQSSIRPILSDYGLEQQNHGPAPQDRRKQKSNAQKKRSKSSTFDDNYDDERQNARRERHLQRYEDIQKLRALHYKVYLGHLKVKVDQQREQIRRKTEEKENKMRDQEEKERKESHRVKRRLQRHLLKHDDDFVRNIPKSDHYKIVALQEKLKLAGKLCHQEDYDKFWEDVKNPALLRRYMYIYKPLPTEPSVLSNNSYTGSRSDLNHRSRTSSMSHSVVHNASHTAHAVNSGHTSNTEAKPAIAPAQPAADYRPMTQIQESRESSRPVTREQLTDAKDKGSSPKSDRRKQMDPYMIAKIWNF